MTSQEVLNEMFTAGVTSPAAGACQRRVWGEVGPHDPLSDGVGGLVDTGRSKRGAGARLSPSCSSARAPPPVRASDAGSRSTRPPTTRSPRCPGRPAPRSPSRSRRGCTAGDRRRRRTRRRPRSSCRRRPWPPTSPRRGRRRTRASEREFGQLDRLRRADDLDVVRVVDERRAHRAPACVSHEDWRLGNGADHRATSSSRSASHSSFAKPTRRASSIGSDHRALVGRENLALLVELDGEPLRRPAGRPNPRRSHACGAAWQPTSRARRSRGSAARGRASRRERAAEDRAGLEVGKRSHTYSTSSANVIPATMVLISNHVARSGCHEPPCRRRSRRCVQARRRGLEQCPALVLHRRAPD
jgi:hypothetical protein